MLSSDTRLVRVMDRLVDMLHKNHNLSTDLSHENPENKLTLDQFKHDMEELCKEINQKANKRPLLNFEYPITHNDIVLNESGKFQHCHSYIIHRRTYVPPNQGLIESFLTNTYSYVEIAFNENDQLLGIRTEKYTGSYLNPEHNMTGPFEIIEIKPPAATTLQAVHEKIYKSLNFRYVRYDK